MSTKEQTEIQAIDENGCKKFETLQFLENKVPNSYKSEEKSQEKCSENSFFEAALPKNEEAFHQKDESPLENTCEAADDKNCNQTTLNENQIPVPSENSHLLSNIGVSSENFISDAAAMSRPNVQKSRLPNSTSSRSTLPHNNARIPGELSGQPSIKNAKDDLKYWKNREQELLAKIAELESKITEKDSKFQGPLDPVATQVKEKLEHDLMVSVKKRKPITQATNREKENYKNRLQTIEKELYLKQKEISTEPNFKNLKSSDEVISHLKLQNEDLRNALAKMTAILRDKTTMCISQEKKIAALLNQVESLKEVVAITKDLLNIRNMEVQHLSSDISSMETKIECERQRHNQMLVKMDEAVKLNSELKKEYENQLKLFQHLRDNYEEKILLLSRNVEKIEAPAVEQKKPSEGSPAAT